MKLSSFRHHILLVVFCLQDPLRQVVDDVDQEKMGKNICWKIERTLYLVPNCGS